MNSLKTKFHIFATLLAETLIKVLWLFPIRKNQVMFISYAGNYSDSPKYIYKELKRRNSSLECVWAVNKSCEHEIEIKDCKKVQFGSFSYLRELTRSNVVILNNVLYTYIPRRKNQLFINTWHGGSPLKTVGMVDENISEFDRFFYKEHAKKYSVYSSSSKFMTEDVFRRSFGFKGEIFNCGLPRNAILFRDHSQVVQNVSNHFNIPIDDDHGIILYAPTHRGSVANAGFISTDQQFDIERCIKEMEARFNKKYSFLFRSHYFDSDVPKNCIIATDYPDMQELMAASDVLITDYSSCMGDMCLMYKPAFLYVPDIEEYIKDRGFYWDIYSLPFPVARDEESFLNQIRCFNQERYNAGVDQYLERLESYERPDTDIKFVDYLIEKIRRVNSDE